MFTQIIKEMNESLETYKQQYKILELVEPLLKPFEGKKITARIETAVKKVLEPMGYDVRYFPDYSWYTLKVYGNGLKYDNAVRFNLGYKGNTNLFGEFTMKNFESNNKCYYANKERIDHLTNQLTNQLTNPNVLREFVTRYENIKKLQEEFENDVIKTYGYEFKHKFKF